MAGGNLFKGFNIFEHFFSTFIQPSHRAVLLTGILTAGIRRCGLR